MHSVGENDKKEEEVSEENLLYIAHCTCTKTRDMSRAEFQTMKQTDESEFLSRTWTIGFYWISHTDDNVQLELWK